MKLQQKKTRRGWEMSGARVKSTVGAVLIAASGVLTGLEAGAQVDAGIAGVSTVETEPQGGQKTAPASHTFDIPAGVITQALDAYQNVTGTHVEVNLPAAKLAGVHTAGVHGVLADRAALNRILEHTGLSATTAADGHFVVGLRNEESVDVTGTISSIGLQQFPETVLDTAQTVGVVPQFIMQDEAVTTLRDALRNVPGVTMAAGEGGTQGDTLTIRGFSGRNDIYLDGIRDFGSYYRDAFDYESVDVLQGPAGVEFGRGSTGGVVNQESKEPQARPFVHSNLQLGTDSMRRLAVDVNRPIVEMPGAAFRVNLVGEQSKYAGRDVSEIRRFGIAPALIFGLNTKTRVLLQYLHEGENTTPDYGLPYFGNTVANVRGANFYGFASDNFLRTSPDILTGKVEHDLGGVAVVRNVLRFATYPRDVRVTEPQVNTTAAVKNPTVVGQAATATCDPTIVNNPAGTPATAACYPLTTPLSQIQVKQNELNVRSTEDILWDQVSATGHFNFLHMANDGIILLEGGRERSSPTRNSYTMPYVSLLNPNPYAAFAPVIATTGLTGHIVSQSFGVGFNDTLKVRDWLLLSGGVRFDYFSTTAQNVPSATITTPAQAGGCLLLPTGYTTCERVDKQPTYRAAVVVKPKPQGSVYFDYGTSFNPSAESLSLSGNNATAPPEENTSLEVGAKWSYFRDRLNINGSLFRTEKDNAHETDPNNSLNTVTVGTYMVHGAQMGGLGHLPQHFDVVFGYAYLNARLENSILNASPFNAVNIALIALKDPRANTRPFFISPNGAPIAQVAKNTGNIFVTHSIWKGFVGGFGGNYTSARRASSGTMIGLYTSSTPIDVTQVTLAPKSVPGYYLFSAMLQHPLTEHINFQVNVNNLLNKFYIDEPHPNHLVPGETINAQFNVSYTF